MLPDLAPVTEHDAAVILGRLFPVPTSDLTTIRALVHLRRELGWDHLVYGGRDSREHVWRNPAPYRHHAEKVSLWNGQLEYRAADAHGVSAVLVVESLADVLVFLRLARVLPTQEQVAA